QKPYPPIWIGGGGEQKTLRIVAEHADVWNMAGGDLETANHKVEVLHRHCADVGRDPAEIRLSVQLRFDESDPDAVLRSAESFLQAGFTELIVIVGGDEPRAASEAVARDVLPRLRA
ncbi:MAG: LLM class flavin-dependent oxidoreductase, partial [Chloroflexi bacterium]